MSGQNCRNCGALFTVIRGLGRQATQGATFCPNCGASMVDNNHPTRWQRPTGDWPLKGQSVVLAELKDVTRPASGVCLSFRRHFSPDRNRPSLNGIVAFLPLPVLPPEMLIDTQEN